jgi:hypothetical protein
MKVTIDATKGPQDGESPFTTDRYSGEIIVQFACEDGANEAALDNALSAYFAAITEGGRVDPRDMPAYRGAFAGRA